MNNLNTVLMEGTLVRDPERSNQAEGSSTCKLALANNRYFIGKTGKWEQDASFFSIYVFGPVAEACLRILKKGRGIRIVGRLKQLRFTVAGLSREKVAILAEHIEFQPERKTEEKEIPVPEKEPGIIETKADSSLEMEDTVEQPDSQEEPSKPEDCIPAEEIVETAEDDGEIDAPF
ncbi:MAG: single-stranded DNA-binding protein [Spirochaetales bacterium]|nr:single-stranded DNA-binding protein [Spirochaetales bacterium]